MIVSRCLVSVGNKSKWVNLIRKDFMPSRHFATTVENENFEALILKNTVISRKHLTPELQLRLITPECDLWHCKASESQFPTDPFWGIYWPGGQALSRYVLDNKEHIQGKNVLDIGSGSGASALAAAKVGAKFVLANDIDPISISAISLNARLNNLPVHTCCEDLIGKDIDSLIIKTDKGAVKLNWEVILIGDMFYDTEFSSELFIWLSTLVSKNKFVLVGDPGRHALKELDSLKEYGELVKIAEYSLCDKEHNGISSSSVFKMEKGTHPLEGRTEGARGRAHQEAERSRRGKLKIKRKEIKRIKMERAKARGKL